MYDYKLPKINDYDLLIKLLKNNDNNVKNNLEVCNSYKREDMITQMLKDE